MKGRLMLFYFEKKEVLINFLLIVALGVALVSHDEKITSGAIGFAAGIGLLNLGKSIGRVNQKNRMPEGE